MFWYAIRGLLIIIGAVETGRRVGRMQERKEQQRTNNRSSIKKDREYNKLRKQFKRLKTFLDEDINLRNSIVAFYAIALAFISYGKDKISKTKFKEIDKIIMGLFSDKIPEAMKEKINEMKSNPPSIEIAHTYALQAKLVQNEIFNLILNVLNETKGLNNKTNKFEFNVRWKELFSNNQYGES